MKKETAAMQAVAEFYFSEAPELKGLGGAEVSEVVKRLGILRYGYEARVRSSLEHACGFFKSKWPEEKWLAIGKKFCYQQAFREEQLGLLPLSFFDFLKDMDLSAGEREALLKDRAVFESRQNPFQESLNHDDLQLLRENSELRLQATVFWVAREQGGWVVSRNRERFFEIEVSLSILQMLEKLKYKSFSIEEWMASATEERLLADFLTLAVSYHWLQK